MNAQALLVRAAIILAFTQSARAPDTFVVIVNAANPIQTVRVTDLSKIFLGKQAKWDGGAAIQPVDQNLASATRREFSQAVHRMDLPRVKSYWQEMVFSGRGEPPPERVSDAEVVTFVRRYPNAIGYVSVVTSVVDVKVVTVTK